MMCFTDCEQSLVDDTLKNKILLATSDFLIRRSWQTCYISERNFKKAWLCLKLSKLTLKIYAEQNYSHNQNDPKSDSIGKIHTIKSYLLKANLKKILSSAYRC